MVCILPSLTREAIRAISVTKVGDQRRLLTAIDELRELADPTMAALGGSFGWWVRSAFASRRPMPGQLCAGPERSPGGLQKRLRSRTTVQPGGKASPAVRPALQAVVFGFSETDPPAGPTFT